VAVVVIVVIVTDFRFAAFVLVFCAETLGIGMLLLVVLCIGLVRRVGSIGVFLI